MNRLVSAIAVLAFVPWTTIGTAQSSPRLLRDVHAVQVAEPSSSPRRFTAFGGRALFTAATRAHGRELWIVDASGARMLRDLRPGPESSAPEDFVVVQGRVFFSADDGLRGRELWVTDGTAAGTRIVHDFAAGSADGLRQRGRARVTPWRGGVLFFADSPTAGNEPHWSDGTADGTRLVADLTPGVEDSSGNGFAPLGADVVIATSAGIWRSDGTSSGTTRIQGPVQPEHLVAAGGAVWFAAGDASAGREPWRSDGTPGGTARVADLLPGAGSSVPRAIATDGAQVFVAVATGASGGGELWRFDASQAGPGTRLATLGVGTPQTYAQTFRTLGSRLLFLRRDPVAGVELHVTDGTVAGTTVLLDCNPGSADGEPAAVTTIGNRAWFFARDGAGSGRALWHTDGTLGGTARIAGLAPVPSAASAFDPEAACAMVAGLVVGGATDAAGDAELWSFEPSPPIRIANLARAPPGATGDSDPSDPFALGTRTVFFADDGVHGREPWIRDATTGGTRLLRDVTPGAEGSDPADPVRIGGQLYFVATTPAHGRELWVTDGTTAGTRLVRDIRPGTASSSPGEACAFRGRLWFAADDGQHGVELWTTDGTATGTALLTDLQPGSGGSDPAELLDLGDRLLFRAADVRFDEELWSTDGTVAGTRRVADIRPGPAGSLVRGLVAVDGFALFLARDNGGSFPVGQADQLWRTDGTTQGTVRVADLWTGGDGVDRLVVAGQRAFFTAGVAVPRTGRELWVTDGTPLGTRMVGDLEPGRAGSEPSELVPLGDRVVFRARTRAAGAELWVSDGSPLGLGTRLVADLAPGPGDARPRDLVATGARSVWFRAAPTGDPELWVTDGTSTGTRRVADLRQGPVGSAPRPLAAPHGRLWFAADDGVAGREPWLIDVGATSWRATPGCSSSGPPVPLHVDDPVLGARWTFGGRARADVVALVPILGPIAAVPFDLGVAGCRLAVDPLGGLQLGPIVPAGRPTWQVGFDLPADPALDGLELAVQAAFLRQATPFGRDWSAGYGLRLGR